MAKNDENLLKLIEDCSEQELNSNLNILRSDLGCTDKNISWLQLVASKFEANQDITSLNLYEKIQMLRELQKLVPIILKLSSDLLNDVKSTPGLCRRHKFNFNLNLSRNLQTHRSSCRTCTSPTLNNPKPTENTTKTTIRNDEIEQRMYPKHLVDFVRPLDKCDVSTVRLRTDKLIECLLCKYTQPLAKSLGCLKSHVCGKKHLKKLQRCYFNLVNFHQFWSRQTTQIRQKELQFKFVSDHLKCVFCDEHVQFHDVAVHVDGCTGLEKLYPKKTARALFANVPHIELNRYFYPVFQRKSKLVMCLICNVPVNGDHREHVDSPGHVAMQATEQVQVSLRLYHDVWSSLDQSLQKWQTYFVMGPEKMTCTCCDVSINYQAAVLKKHLWNMDHVMSAKELQKTNSGRFIEGADKRYQNRAQWHLFRGVRFIEVAGDLYPTFQKVVSPRGLQFFCVICNENVGPTRFKKRHENNPSHVTKSRDTALQESLARYFQVWNRLPVPMQYKQVDFRRGPEKMTCVVCDTSLDYDVACVLGHLMSEQHLNMNERDKESMGDDPTVEVWKSELPESSSDVKLEISYTEPSVFYVLSEDERADLDESELEPPTKRIKIEEEPAESKGDYVDEKPGYVYYDYNEPNFIPLTRNTEREVVPTVKTEPGCSDTARYLFPS